MSFDECALAYDRQLRRGLRLSGEGPEWFARQRVAFVAKHLGQTGHSPNIILEFGCGTGNHVPFLRTAFQDCTIVGVDVSSESLRVARQRHAGDDIRFYTPTEFDEPQSVDLVFVNGVFHHIPPAEHDRWLAYLARLLRPGGSAAIFDNSPFNPGARLVMRLIPFDRDAVMVNPYRFRKQMAEYGFASPRLRFHFIFPRVLSVLRPVEQALARWPIGAQFGLIAEKLGQGWSQPF
ncbi:MAG TPA: class I SAM-dependent methyltransferase [Phycisphaerae bacterium]|nr:class I SAM-dependent methyltransferase [Phycisphaerae bacterium]